MKSKWRQETDYQGMGSRSLEGTQCAGPIGLQKLSTDSLGLAEGGSALAARDGVKKSGHDRKLHLEWWVPVPFQILMAMLETEQVFGKTGSEKYIIY